jgi:hypothetical protein
VKVNLDGHTCMQKLRVPLQVLLDLVSNLNKKGFKFEFQTKQNS